MSLGKLTAGPLPTALSLNACLLSACTRLFLLLTKLPDKYSYNDHFIQISGTLL